MSSVRFGLVLWWFSRRSAWRRCRGAQWNPPNPVVSFEKRPGGLEVRQKNGVLRMEVNAADVLHVTYSPLEAEKEVHPSDHVVIKQDWPASSFEVTSE